MRAMTRATNVELHPVPEDLASDADYVTRLESLVARWSGPERFLSRTFGLERTRDGLTLVSEPVAPVDLRDAADEASRVPSDAIDDSNERWSSRIVWAVARAIEVAGVLERVAATHGDVSRATVRIALDGTTRLLPPVARLTVSRAQNVTGRVSARIPSFAAMPPEAVLGKTLDAKSDVFQLGGLLYVLLGQALPFARESDMATVQAIVSNEPARPIHALVELGGPRLVALSQIVATALSKDPAARPESPAAFAAALAPFVDEAVDARMRSFIMAHVRREPRTEARGSYFQGFIERPCPRAWDELTPTADARVRHCATCELDVERVGTLAGLIPLRGRCASFEPL